MLHSIARNRTFTIQPKVIH